MMGDPFVTAGFKPVLLSQIKSGPCDKCRSPGFEYIEIRDRQNHSRFACSKHLREIFKSLNPNPADMEPWASPASGTDPHPPAPEGQERKP